MSDEIREFLREAAGPRETAPLDVEALVRRSRRRRAGRAAAGVAMVVGIALAAVGVVELPRSGPVEPVVEPPPPPALTPEETTPPGTTPEAVAPGEATLRFTFTGAEGPDGCRYEGPSRVIAGKHAIEFVDATEGQQGTIAIEPLAEGSDFEDFVASLRDVDDPRVTAPNRTEPPYRFDRKIEYQWRPEPSTSFGLEGLRIVQGAEIELDEVSMPVGQHAMSCAVHREDDLNEYDLWPVAELTVVEAP